MNYPYIKTASFISVTIEGRPYTVPHTHSNFSQLEAAIKAQDWALVKRVVNLSLAIQEYCGGTILIKEGILCYKGESVDTSISRRILTMMKEGFDVNPLANFLDRLMSNPSYRAGKELYGFLEHGKLPITEDGYFLAYKKVNENFMDIYTGNFDNSVGSICSMPRNEVDEDKDRTCSNGLHFCSYDYLTNYGSANNNKVVVLKIDPANVVAIPSDYNNTKGRCCEYEVIDVVSDWAEENTLAKTSVYVGSGIDEHYCSECGDVIVEHEGERCDACRQEDCSTVCEECGCILTSYENDICASCEEAQGNDDDIPIYCDECGSVEVDNEGDECPFCQDDKLGTDVGAEPETDEEDTDEEDTELLPLAHKNMRCVDCGGIHEAEATECRYCRCTVLREVF